MISKGESKMNRNKQKKLKQEYTKGMQRKPKDKDFNEFYDTLAEMVINKDIGFKYLACNRRNEIDFCILANGLLYLKDIYKDNKDITNPIDEFLSEYRTEIDDDINLRNFISS